MFCANKVESEGGESRDSLSWLSGRIRKKMVWCEADGGDTAGLMDGGARDSAHVVKHSMLRG